MSRHPKKRADVTASDLQMACLGLLLALDHRSPVWGDRISAIGGYAWLAVDHAWTLVSRVLDEGFASFVEEVAREIRYAMSVALAIDIDGGPLTEHETALWNRGLLEAYTVLNWQTDGDLCRTTDLLSGASGKIYSIEYIKGVEEIIHRPRTESLERVVRPEVAG